MYGAEFALKQKAGKSFDIRPTYTLQYRNVKVNINNPDLSYEGFKWKAKLISNYKIEPGNAKSIFNNSRT
jgi:hypothetical protein